MECKIKGDKKLHEIVLTWTIHVNIWRMKLFVKAAIHLRIFNVYFYQKPAAQQTYKVMNQQISAD